MPETLVTKPRSHDDKPSTSSYRCAALGADISIFFHRVTTAQDSREETLRDTPVEKKTSGMSGIKGNGDKSDG